ncbi:Rrf2 family transcriptional regulator [Roseisolibacter sp. H3M3-2]|uniref:RrF2 family transcriptional regulator n=1 Tax=Roseisolibacter sp. H3M3-2 TaxID=3031323 RepID=UPI0023D98659|nr:Rrf2 family transcriptional regulator [Roseisolibacter sp. H3M3-2]MDF1501380.1 Rrf2 family transcriptional regulator [Roseisolibacter sp. H3M3-2]
MLSQTSDHALRALLVLARRHGAGPVRTEEIADATGAPRNYLSKTLHALVKAGLVASARGPLGGFALAVAPDALTLARVIDCFDEPRPQTRCLLGTRPCDPARPCAAHHRWTAILEARRAPLATTTLADLLADATPLLHTLHPDGAPAAAAPSPASLGYDPTARLAAASAA